MSTSEQWLQPHERKPGLWARVRPHMFVPFWLAAFTFVILFHFSISVVVGTATEYPRPRTFVYPFALTGVLGLFQLAGAFSQKQRWEAVAVAMGGIPILDHGSSLHRWLDVHWPWPVVAAALQPRGLHPRVAGLYWDTPVFVSVRGFAWFDRRRKRPDIVDVFVSRGASGRLNPAAQDALVRGAYEARAQVRVVGAGVHFTLSGTVLDVATLLRLLDLARRAYV